MQLQVCAARARCSDEGEPKGEGNTPVSFVQSLDSYLNVDRESAVHEE